MTPFLLIVKSTIILFIVLLYLAYKESINIVNPIADTIDTVKNE